MKVKKKQIFNHFFSFSIHLPPWPHDPIEEDFERHIFSPIQMLHKLLQVTKPSYYYIAALT